MASTSRLAGNGVSAAALASAAAPPDSASDSGSLHYAFKQLILKGEDTFIIELRQEWPRGREVCNLSSSPATPHVGGFDGAAARPSSSSTASASHLPSVPGCGAFQLDAASHYSLFGVFDGHCGGELARHCARNAADAVRAALSSCRRQSLRGDGGDARASPSSSGCGPPPRGALDGCESCRQGLGRRGTSAVAAAPSFRRRRSKRGRATPSSSIDEDAAPGSSALAASDDDDEEKASPPSCSSCAGAEACESWRSSLQRSLAAAVVSLQASWAARGTLGGSTATLVLVAGRLVTCANVGDSAAFADDGGLGGGSSSAHSFPSSLAPSSLSNPTGDGASAAMARAVVALTGDHRVASNPAEAARVSRCPGACVARLDVAGRGPAPGGGVLSGGGSTGRGGVGPLRLWGNVASSTTTAAPADGAPAATSVASVANARALGDVAIPGLLPLPLVTQCRLPATGGRLLVGSDGVWDCVDAPRAARAARGKAAPEAADAVLSAAMRACPGGVPRDDATVVVVDVLPRGVPSFPEALGKKLKRSASRAAALSAAGLSRQPSSAEGGGASRRGSESERERSERERSEREQLEREQQDVGWPMGSPGGSWSSSGRISSAGSLEATAMLRSPSPSPAPSVACSPRRGSGVGSQLEGVNGHHHPSSSAPAVPVFVPPHLSSSSPSSSLAEGLRGGFGSLSIGSGVGASALAAAAAEAGGSCRSGSGRGGGGILAFGSAWRVSAAGRSLDDGDEDGGGIGVGLCGEASMLRRTTSGGGGSGRGGCSRGTAEGDALPPRPSPSPSPPPGNGGASLPPTPQPRPRPPASLFLPPLPPPPPSSSSPAPVALAAPPPLPPVFPAARPATTSGRAEPRPSAPPPQLPPVTLRKEKNSQAKKSAFSFLIPKKVREKREAKEAAAAAAAACSTRPSFPSTSELSPTPPSSPSPRTAAEIASDDGGGERGRGAGGRGERSGSLIPRSSSNYFVVDRGGGSGRPSRSSSRDRPPPHSPGGGGGDGILGNVASREHSRHGSSGFRHPPSPSSLDAGGESLRGGTGFFASLAESVRGGTAFFDGSRGGGGDGVQGGGDKSVRRGVAFFGSVRSGSGGGAVSEGIAVLSRVDTARVVDGDDGDEDDGDGDGAGPPASSWLDRDAALRARLRACVREACEAYATAAAARARGEAEEVEARASSVSTSAVASALV